MQRRWTREITNISHLDVERVKALELFSIFGRLLRADLIKCWKSFHSEVDVGLLDGFTVAVDRRTRGHSYKVVVSRCELDMRRHFFMYGLFSSGIHYLRVLLCNLHCLLLRENWTRNWEIYCLQYCSFSPVLFFFFSFWFLCLFVSVMFKV